MESIARIIVLLLAVALILQLSKGGWPAVWSWLKIKYTGKP
jgi:hypothetical protein